MVSQDLRGEADSVGWPAETAPGRWTSWWPSAGGLLLATGWHSRRWYLLVDDAACQHCAFERASLLDHPPGEWQQPVPCPAGMDSICQFDRLHQQAIDYHSFRYLCWGGVSLQQPMLGDVAEFGCLGMGWHPGLVFPFVKLLGSAHRGEAEPSQDLSLDFGIVVGGRKGEREVSPLCFTGEKVASARAHSSSGHLSWWAVFSKI
ncbi:uncharacterized protein LOC113110947 [Carassius auratus]|uniref:Uncharacterized protein LOC113110947 n=1 Tax=Carassius auratus TaxID=7957 RepID=A0A6P6QBY8_CARAU|nr:uncharacterized protein LOC113110947 [Carassius auratus]